MTLTVAVGELTRVLPWSLRALGYPFGTADRAAHLVATAAALDPGVLDAIARAGQRPAGPVRVVRGTGELRVEAAGVSLLETGPVVMDHLAAHAGEAPVVAARIAGASEPGLLPAVLLVGAGHGLTAIALRPPQQGGGWVAAVPGDGAPVLYAGGDVAELLARLPDAALAGRVAAAGPCEDLLVLATERPVAIPFATPGIRAAEALAVAEARGLPVSRDTLAALYALEVITWAPSSERSRAQAGFVPKPAAAT